MPGQEKGHFVYNIVTFITNCRKTPFPSAKYGVSCVSRIVRAAAPLYNGSSSAPVSISQAAGGKRCGARHASAKKANREVVRAMQQKTAPEPETTLSTLAARRGITMKGASRISLYLALCFFAVICFVLYVPRHIGAADNGDYWRYAGVIGVSGTESFSGDAYPYTYKFYDPWLWLPFSADQLSPLKPQLSNAYPVAVVRLLTNVLGDTAVNPYQLWYLSLVCIPLILFAAYHLFRFGLLAMGKGGIAFLVAGILMLSGSAHLGYLHSFYGEAMMYVWLLMALGTACGAIVAKKGSLSGRIFCAAAVISAHMMLTSKGQSVVAYPVWAAVLLPLAWHHFMGAPAADTARARKPRKRLNALLMLLLTAAVALSGVSCVKLYLWNSDVVSTYNVYNSLINGLLPIVDDPQETLAELDLDPVFAKDIGRSAFEPDLQVPLGSPKLQEMLFDKLTVMDVLKYYLTHPKYLFRVLQITAEHATAYDSKLILEHYADAANGEGLYRGAMKFAFWQAVRPFVTPGSFVYYVVFYGALFAVCGVSLLRNRKKPRKRLTVLLLLGLMVTGLLQFPLPVIGNGLADASKQLYLFMLSYDLTLVAVGGWIFTAVRARRAKGPFFPRRRAAAPAGAPGGKP